MKVTDPDADLCTSRAATPPIRPDLSAWPEFKVTARYRKKSYESTLRAPNENLALTAGMRVVWEEHGIEPEADVKYSVRMLNG